MDPVSSAASIIAVVQLSGSVINLCYNYVKSVRDGRKEVMQFVEELNDLKRILERLLEIALKHETSQSPFPMPMLEIFGNDDSILTECENFLKQLEPRLKPNGLKGAVQALKWPLKEKETKAELERIERLKKSLTLALAVDNTALALDTHQIASGCFRILTSIAEAFVPFQRANNRRLIRQCVDALNLSLNHNISWRPSMDVSTLQSQAYHEWKTNKSPIMWPQGIRGCARAKLLDVLDAINRFELLQMLAYMSKWNTQDRHILIPSSSVVDMRDQVKLLANLSWNAPDERNQTSLLSAVTWPMMVLVKLSLEKQVTITQDVIEVVIERHSVEFL
ncbi:hypothetical protein L228DRAFT_241725 [Xylona heveae TC161]|uniref:Azaphilone pigments biosynthesis cluster protein L N-terminal domain-containing protein n=1 Tax=Xylona heveae (strain CBS 132557 / TC161) TaxID=1328760 RepID=A0A164ZTT1_XYLHT|nr:hypothetical protein L228DRAFT_241725 [Xylona heveae TC161]KZF19506.1 hypothetical protein L228DRAFT_241725 [Xylona heveae TC161]